MGVIKTQYGFPLFVKDRSTDYILKADKIRVSDIWALWHFIIKAEKKKYPGSTDYGFLIAVLEQAQYFYEAANSAPIKSKPLLYYYSFLNLAKAVIVLNNPAWMATNLEFNHGVDACQINSTTQLKDCYIIVKNLINSAGVHQKLSVAYLFAQIQGDDIEHLVRAPAGHDNGPWKLDITSLFKSCIGIHRTVSSTFKCEESFHHIVNPYMYKMGRTISFKGKIETTHLNRNRLINAGYNIMLDESNWLLSENKTMLNSNVSRSEFLSFSSMLLKKGLWSYTTGEDYRIYINPNRLIKDATGIYLFENYDASIPNLNTLTLSSATIIYLIMFFLGSITRYHPYIFEKVLNDKELWMVSEFLTTQPLQFLLLVTSRVLGRPIYTSRMPFNNI